MVILTVLKFLVEKPTNSVKLFNAYIFQIFVNSFHCIVYYFVFIFYLKDSKIWKTQNKGGLEKSII